MTLSSRERVLIIMLLFICIVVGGFKFLIEPQMTRLSKNQTDLTVALARKAEMQTLSNVNDNNENNLEKLRQKAQEGSVVFFDDMSNAQVQQWISGISSQSGLAMVNLSINNKAVYELGSAQQPSEQLTYPLYEYAQKIKQKNTAPVETSGSAEKAIVVCHKAQAELRGTYDQILDFIDRVYHYEKACKLSNLTLNKLEGELTVNVDIMLFSVEKIN